MFCTQCGTQLEDTSRYCTRCGKPTAAGFGFATTEQTALPPPRRLLRRIVQRKKLAGVCAGFAEYFDMDVTLMRVIWLALILLPPNLGLIGYIVAWAVMPKADTV